MPNYLPLARPLALAGAAALALTPAAGASAAAQPAPGSTLIFTASADATDIGLGGVRVDFGPQVTAGGAGNTGAFAWLNQTSGPGVAGQISGVRVGNGPESVPDFLVLGGYTFAVDSLPSGTYGQDACYVAPAPGQQCTPFQSVQGQPQVNAGLSPFSVTNAATPNPDGSLNSTAAFDVFGTVTGPDGVTSNFVGTISSTFFGLPYQQVLSTLEQQGLQGVALTGTFTVGAAATVTPEPATCTLVAAGLVGAAVAARRRRRAA